MATKKQLIALARMRARKRYARRKKYMPRVGYRRITGRGDYKITANTVLKSKVPLFQDGKASINISFREYIGPVRSSTIFSIYKYRLNPGLPETFPWLSAVASAYQEYELKGCVFNYINRSSNALNSTNTALGSVILAWNPNAAQNNPASKKEVLNYEFSAVGKPSEDLILPIECDPKQSVADKLYIRTPSMDITGQDIKTYDFGNVFLCSEGAQAQSEIGDLYVSYHFVFRKCRIPDQKALTDYFNFTAGVSSTKYFGTNATSSDDSNFGCTLSDDTITFPDYFEGSVLIYYQLKGASSAYTTPNITPSGNVVVNNIYESDTVNVEGINTTSTKQMICASFKMTQADTPGENKITFAGGTLVASVTDGELIITSISDENN